MNQSPQSHSSAVLGAPATLTFNYTGNIAFLEHTVVTATVTTNDLGMRGDTQLELISPSGTVSTILFYRDQDDTMGASYLNWPFMSVHYWGEDPTGQWTLVLTLRGEGRANISDLLLTLYGASETPEAVSRIPESCDPACDPNRGCANDGPEFCDACAGRRHAYTLECMDECPLGFSQRNGYCYNASLPEPQCNRTITGERWFIFHNKQGHNSQ